MSGQFHTTSEELALTKRVRKGDQQALETLIGINLRFVVSTARQFQDQGLPLETLIGKGTTGLIKAARRFDETKGVKFSSFAVWWIRRAIQEALRKKFGNAGG